MKFVDETNIAVIAGKGGDGCASFRREKYIPRGGPNGGDGGNGGSVYLVADEALNTLSEFRTRRKFKAGSGEQGMGRERYGKAADDLEVRVPIGTTVTDQDTGEVIGDMTVPEQRLLVAQGGRGGLGNVHFKSSVNRAPQQSTPGTPGESRNLTLELKLLADVGLLGLPNAGKSTLIRAVSNAKPKVADYPFTTLHPNLGVVDIDFDRSFVIADVPGLVEGAADGAGLGVRFLKHLQRTRLLFHLVDVMPLDEERNPVEDVQIIMNELEQFSPELAKLPCWLVINKADLLPADDCAARCAEITQALNWTDPVYQISAVTGVGTQQLVQDAMNELERLDEASNYRQAKAAEEPSVDDDAGWDDDWSGVDAGEEAGDALDDDGMAVVYTEGH